MRILHLTDHYTPVLGGIEAHVAALAARQAAAGHDVTVLTSTPAVADGRAADDAGPVSVLRGRSLLTAAADLTSYDVVHAHVSVIAPFSAPRPRRPPGAACRRWSPSTRCGAAPGPLPSVAAQLAGLRSAPVRWTAVSRVAAEQLARRLPRGTRVGVLPNAVDGAPPGSTSRRTQPGRPVRLVSTMRVARRKRPLPLLRVYADLVRTLDQPVELVVIGDGPQRPRLEREIDRAGLRDQVHVTGRLEPSDVLDRLGASDVYVAPAILESFGLAALEARAVGLPVVGRAGSGLTDFVAPRRRGAAVRLGHGDGRRAPPAGGRPGTAPAHLRAQPHGPVTDDLVACHGRARRGLRPRAIRGADRTARPCASAGKAGERRGRPVAAHPRVVPRAPRRRVPAHGRHLARASAEGHRVVLVTATGGTAGSPGPHDGHGATLARRRMDELAVAAQAWAAPGRRPGVRRLGAAPGPGGRRRLRTRRRRGGRAHGSPRSSCPSARTS